ncbi:MAG: aminoacyl-tRNA hydrolase [Myxococcales bacterium 68-20]|nr:aminoacyl-tRNA hydrolase [Myxococcales bacterium]OJY17926.1 MAG: aminoacyl-tRNA hydrolase [Myxococcales bacterium 68-20]
MYLVVGLGNPGKKYEKNRHNVGFMVVERLARSHGLPDFKEKFSAVWTKGELAAGGARHPVALIQPQTFMNLSGDSVQPAAAFLKVDPPKVIVVHDELDLPWQDVRLKVGGGHAGHNGLRSIMQRLGSPEFIRVRVGVGRPPPGFKGDVADYVLADFDAMERAELPDVVDRASSAIEKIVAEGIAPAMNAVNTKK